MIKNIRFVFGLVFLSLLLLPVSNVSAEHYDFSNSLSFGAYFLSQEESEIGISDTGSGFGATVDPSDTLGLDSEKQVLKLDGAYRFNDNHSFLYSWYSLKSSGTRTISTEIPWDPDPIPVGARVDSSTNTDIYKLGYLWSFYHSDKVELGIGAGLHVTKIKIKVSADINGGSYQGEAVDATLPLPVGIFKLGYKITPDLELTYLSQLFALGINGVSGLYTDQELRLEYRFWKHVGLGLGLNSTNTSLEQDKDGRVLKYNSNVTGGILFVSGYF